MKALILEKPHTDLIIKEVPIPEINRTQVLIKVHVCGVCRTDLHIVEGELKNVNFPIILGHQVVGTVEKTGQDVTQFKVGDRVGVPWLGSTCHTCFYCNNGQENLCDNALFTGCNLQGGFAEYCAAEEGAIFPIPAHFDDVQAAPLLCAGLIGYRSYKKTGNSQKIGFYGFGSSAHILTQLAVHEKKEIFAFTKEGDIEGQKFAKKLGAVWTGSSNETPPCPLDAAIVFASIGSLMTKALQDVRKGGIVISACIHMSPIPSFSYDLLWEERTLTSVANLTHQDGIDFFKALKGVPLHVETILFPFNRANEAIDALRKPHTGSIVLKI